MLVLKSTDAYPGRDNFFSITNVPHCNICKAKKPDDPIEKIGWYHETRRLDGMDTSYDICQECQNKEQKVMAKLLAKIELKNIQAGINQLRQEYIEIETRIARKELKYQMVKKILRGME